MKRALLLLLMFVQLCVMAQTHLYRGNSTYSGNIICTSPKTFIERKNGSNFAFNIYYAAKRKNSPLGNAEIAQRAQAKVGRHQTYSVWTDNCHGFTLGCITGNFDQHHNYRLGEIANAISEYYGTDDWEWRAWDFDNV